MLPPFPNYFLPFHNSPSLLGLFPIAHFSRTVSFISAKFSGMKHLLFTACFLLILTFGYSQSVGIGTTTPHASAMLDVTSTKGGILFPRMTTVQRTTQIPSPAPGLMVYDTDLKQHFIYNGGWHNLLIDNDKYWLGSTFNNWVYNNTDSIGVGTTSPLEKLHLRNGQFLLSRSSSFENNIVMDMPKYSGFTSESESIRFRVNGGDSASIGYLSTPIGASVLRLSGNGAFSSDITINTLGNVGIGTSSQSEKLEVRGNALISNNGVLMLEKSSGLKTVEIKSTESGTDGASMLLYNKDGLVTIEIDADYGDGDGRVITSELQIKGGSDLAENFDLAEAEEKEAKPGMLVSIDTKKEGALCLTNVAADKKIVGVISGANGIKPGMLMGQQGSIAFGKYPVALAGRVYVLCNAEGGAIAAGDFLTSSSQKGYAKKADNFQEAQGAIIGKAMGGVNPQTGYALVLVNLQ